MQQKTKWLILVMIVVGFLINQPSLMAEESNGEPLASRDFPTRETQISVIEQIRPLARFTYDSGYSFAYPDAVRGIYVTGHTVGHSRFDTLLNMINTTELNSMVIDIKDDRGNLTFRPDEDSPFYDISQPYISDPVKMMEILEENQIYPIARIVVFKDTVLAEKRPDLSFLENGKVWLNNREEAFVNPYEKEVWEYNVEIAKLAVELGFQDIQFDYVRYPEGFERRDQDLEYSQGDYADLDMDNVKKRVEAVTDFVAYAHEELNYYGVDVSVDIFGYAVTVEETPGIGQNFSRISENVDVISSMIYPSHWTPHFGIDYPDEEPYELVDAYSKIENDVLGKLDDAPISRPWIQDFEAPWLYTSRGLPTFQYDVAEVEAQIRALNENGIHEFLLWNAGNVYTQGVDYTPLN